MNTLRLLFLLLFFGVPLSGYTQIADFTIQVNTVPETCTNNGKISIAVSNITPNAVVTYQLFRAPDFVIPIAETLQNSFSSLSGGNYRVLVTQFLNNQKKSKQADVLLNSTVQLLDFQFSDSANTNCDPTGALTVVVLAGNPTFYEIIAGPVTRPLQTSNVFNNLSSGTYIIRVFDSCNDALSKSYTFIMGNNLLGIGAPVLPDIYTSCTTLDLVSTVTSLNTAPILYPLTVKYTISATNGTLLQTATQNIPTGPGAALQLNQTVNVNGSQSFNVKIEITDNCGNVFVKTSLVDPNPKLTYQVQAGLCGSLFFNLTVKNYFPPYTLNFTAPAAFNPSTFNATYPGPYSTDQSTFGSIQNPTPFGSYSVTALDGCGRSNSLVFSLQDKVLIPQVSTSNNGCASTFGKVTIKIPDNRKIVAISMTQAPASANFTLPYNVQSFVGADGVYTHTNLPVGNYVYKITDSCGDFYTVNVTVPAFVFGNLVSATRPDCGPTTGGVRLSTSNGALVTMNITAAPSTFAFPIPHNVNANINTGGIFYMSGLPAGSYTFAGKDACGFDLQKSVTITGYSGAPAGYQINRKCGSFDIVMNDTDTSITGKTFWLQKFYPATNSWGHPSTGAAYVAGAVPNGTNSRQLNNPGTILNIFAIGEFRIMKVYETFNNNMPNGQCVNLYGSFKVVPELVVLGVYNLSCNDASVPNDAVVDVIGVPPFKFKITSPYVLDNGSDNLFTNLAPGTYNIQVTDFCGSIKNINIEIGKLLPLSVANTPKSMLTCRNDGVQFGIFPLIDQTPQILGNQNPNAYNVTYHLTQQDADSGVNPLPDGYTNISNPQTIYARIQHKIITLCFDTTSFKIFAGLQPILAPSVPVFICDGFSKTLIADSGFSSYLWSTGETTESITVNQAGTYTLTVKNIYADFSCNTSKDYVVTGSSVPTIETINTSDGTSFNNSVVIIVNGAGVYLYSLDNKTFQTSNIFNDLPPGIYTVYVKDGSGCGTAKDTFVLLNYPKYFTPNGDGYNDTWQIQFSKKEAGLGVDIYDRFGKFISRIKGGDSGWDGTLNGQQLPATDYWFVVNRQDGSVYRGHFTLKR